MWQAILIVVFFKSIMTNITITALGVTTTFNKAPITQLGRA
jgi:hypothetical protein